MEVGGVNLLPIMLLSEDLLSLSPPHVHDASRLEEARGGQEEVVGAELLEVVGGGRSPERPVQAGIWCFVASAAR